MADQSTYDQIAGQYAASVQESLGDPTSVIAIASHTLLKAASDIDGLDICDLACGEGHLTVRLAEQAQSVVGIDISERLLNLARQKTDNNRIAFVLDDAQYLSSQVDARFDLVVSNLALMDVPDLAAVYASAYRVLRPEGQFIFSITHPCFQAPHTTIDTAAEGQFAACHISRYSSEGFWRSDYAGGIRGRVGAIHRTFSTYINTLIVTGFHLSELIEPTLPAGQYPDAFSQARVEIPSVLVVRAYKPTTCVDAPSV
jgi:2-polyprenyl-3-methyl-5-hydroxy-6-metoxy-1,4-benzoquinol methylase